MSSLISKDIIHIFLLNTQKLTHHSDSENKSSDYPARKKDYPITSDICNTISYTVSYQADSNSDRILVGCRKSITVSYKNGFENGSVENYPNHFHP